MKLKDIKQTANYILELCSDPIVKYRLMKDVFIVQPDDTEFQNVKKGIMDTVLIKRLTQEQKKDGGWGIFHTNPYRITKPDPSTEVAIYRALSYGLDKDSKVINNAVNYMVDILEGKTQWEGRHEKNIRWPVGYRMITAGILAQIDPWNSILDSEWELWLKIAQYTFSGGTHDIAAEINAHGKYTGIRHRELRYLSLHNKFALYLISSRRKNLPTKLNNILLDWLWHKEEGIGYMGVTLQNAISDLKNNPKINQLFIKYYDSVDLLSHFKGWQKYADDFMECLWNKRNTKGLWDFGKIMPVWLLSDSPKKALNPMIDYSVKILILFRKYLSK